MISKNIKARIDPVSETIRRPFWSVMIPTYNRIKYLEKTLMSVMTQFSDTNDVQIEVVDNCSEMDVEGIVKAIGDNKISFYRQLYHVDMSSNWNTCIQRSHGHWVHILHDDDIVMPKYYHCLREALEKESTAGAAFCRFMFIDEEGNYKAVSPLERETPGIISNFVERIFTNSVIYAPAIVVKRDVYVELGGFDSEAYSAADWEMWKRIAVHYPIWYEPQTLACYREDAGSILQKSMLSAKNIADARMAVEISQTYLPETIALELSNRAKENLALLALKKAEEMLNYGKIDGAIAQIWEGLRCSNSSEIIDLMIYLINANKSKEFVMKLLDHGEKHKEDSNSEFILESIKTLLLNLINQNVEPKFVIDGVFFQIYKTGIARVWKSLLEEWAKDGFYKHILVLDRAGTAPRIPGINYRTIQRYDYNKTSLDREILQEICDEENADLFISSYYTTPISTPSVFMAYDMIPEVLKWDLSESRWQEKHFSIRHASAYITISENTARDLVKHFPEVSAELVTVAHCGIDSSFSPATPLEIDSFKTKYGISKPYFILVGARSGYKNGILFFQAFEKLHSKQGFEVVCTSADPIFEDEFRVYTAGTVVHKLELSDAELRIAYSGAVALVFPSQYEGFGLPVLEALACGCPVITTPNASIPEVAGEAALYVNYNDVDGMANALCDVQKPGFRDILIAAGIEQAKKFSWTNMAEKVRDALINTTLLSLKLRDINIIIFPDWFGPEESLYLELEAVIRVVGTHPDRNQITLLIDTSTISETSEIDPNLILSSIVMNLVMQDVDVTDGLEISTLGKLASIQWEALLPRIQARLVLENKTQQTQTRDIPICQLDNFQHKRAIQLETGTWKLE